MTDNKLATVSTHGDPFTAFLERAARDPSIDVAKIKELLAIKREQDAEERRRLFFDALARVQAAAPAMIRSGENPHTRSRYARLDDMLITLRPLLADEGFAFTFDSKPEPVVGERAMIRYTCKLLHRGGHFEERSLVLPADGTGSQGGKSGMNAIQAIGSTTSYARRYLIEMHLNLAKRDEDDDGNGGPSPVTAEQAATLRERLAAIGGDEARFLNWAAAASFEEISGANFQRCMTAIEVMAKRKEARG